MSEFFERIPVNRIRVGHTLRIYGGIVARVTGMREEGTSRSVVTLDVESDVSTVPHGYSAPVEYRLDRDADYSLPVRQEWGVVPHDKISYYVQRGDTVNVDGRITGLVVSSSANVLHILVGTEVRQELVWDTTEIRVRNY